MPKIKAKGYAVAALSDTHSGGTTGLMYPKEYQFADGNVRPTKLQESLFERFDEHAGNVAEMRKGRKLTVTLNGDPVDGVHHDTTQLHTRHMSEQRDMFADVFDHYLRKVNFNAAKGDRLYFVEGTTLRRSHGSPSDTNDIAKDFGAVPFLPPKDADPDDPEDPANFGKKSGGWYPWQVLDLDVAGHVFRFAHHPLAGLGKLPHTRGNAIRSRVRGLQYRWLARGKRIPRFVIWGHVHTMWKELIQLDDGTGEGPITEAIVLPCFQFPTEYVEQKMPWDAEETTIGGWWATVSQDGTEVSHKFDFAELPHRREPQRV